LAIGSIAALGCDRGPRDLQDEKGPAPQMVWSSPSDNTKEVALRQSVRIQFDRFLRADTASRQSICIQPGPNSPCVGASIEYDPVDRVLVAKLQADLQPNTNYIVNVWAPSAQEPDRGVRAFDDVPMASDASFRFTSGTSASMPTLAEPKRTVEFCGTGSPGATFNGCTTCHKPPLGGPLGLGNGGALHFKEANAGVAQTVGALVNQATVAIESATAPDPVEVRRSGPVFGQNMPYLDKGNPANSYALYKMLITPAAAACVFNITDPELQQNYRLQDREATDPLACDRGTGGADPWVPDANSKPAVAGEYDRLFGRLMGQPMTADLPSIRSVSAWIAAGATTPTADCPP
jgi:hypothetical protein